MAVRRKSKMIIVSICLVSVAFFGAWALQEFDDSKRVLEEFRREYSGDIEVVTRILSVDGQPLKGVTVSLSTNTLATALGGNDEEEQFVVDSEFSVRKDSISSINMWFTKAGYYAERWSYSLSGRPKGLLDAVEKVDLRIEMTPEPMPAPLERLEGALRTDVSGPISMLLIATQLPSSEPISRGEEKNRAGTGSSQPHVYLDAGMGGGGRFSTIQFKFKSFSASKPALARSGVRLTHATPGDGFVVADIGQVPPIFEQGFRKMTEAPPDGYQEELALVPESGKENLFFYCRINGLFGKGVVSNPPMVFDGEGVETAVVLTTIYLNPTGSTDVSFLHH